MKQRILLISMAVFFLLGIVLYVKGYGVFLNTFHFPQIGSHIEMIRGGGAVNWEREKFFLTPSKRNVTWIIRPVDRYLIIKDKSNISMCRVTQEEKKVYVKEMLESILSEMEVAEELKSKDVEPFSLSFLDTIELNLEYTDGGNQIYFIYILGESTYIESPSKKIYRCHPKANVYQTLIEILND